ncbi:MAG TPA: low temperature requirement protein A [Solirubrobacteraceae bacterium]|nr:low temperature requirement protein A [Solirubrobacteraceae bacterium]
MSSTARIPRPRLTAVLRDDDRVSPLELFFDLVFVLALTQCTALMAHEPSWTGLAKGLAVLGVMWWAWVGYTWTCSTLDPEEGSVRLVMFAAMAALLIVALAIPQAFGDEALIFALAYGFVRAMQVALLVIGGRDDPGLRHSAYGLAVSTAIGVGLLTAAAFADGTLQGALWAIALTLDVGGPLVIDSSGWRLMPEHFAERHGLIVIIALGESIVAIGVGAEVIGVTAGVAACAVLGIAVAGALWWLYFDVVALVAARRLGNAAPGKEQNEIGRDSFSYLHFPMVAGIVLLALGLKKTLEHTDEALKLVPATALLGGAALYLLAHVAFRWRNIHTLNRQRLAMAIGLPLLIPLAVEVPALAALAGLAALLVGLVAYEVTRFGEARERLRRRLLHGEAG